MAEEVKFTEEEIKQVKEIQDDYFGVQQKFGQIYLAKLRIDNQEKQILEDEDTNLKELENVQDKESKFLKGITDKYGDGSLNPETGVFTPSETSTKSE